MRKRFLATVCILSLIFATISNCVFAVEGKVTGTNVRIRESADSKAPEVSVATKNEVVDVIGEEGDWYKVKFEDVTGYMSKDYVDTDYSSGSSPTLTQENTPNENSSTPPTQTSPAESPTPTEPEPSTNEGQTTTPENPQEPEDTTPETTTPEPTTPEPEVKEEKKVTFENETNLKYLPSFTSRNSCKASGGSTYTVKATLNNWIKVVNDTNSGWVLKTKISGEISEPETTSTSNPDTTPNETSSSDTTTSSTKKGTVNVESARIRREPDGETLDSIDEGTEVTILGEENGWYHIKVGEYDSCYIAKRLITEK